MNNYIKQKTVWNGMYEDIKFEIQNFEYDTSGFENGAWTYYIILPLKQLPEDIREDFWLTPKSDSITGRPYYDYYRNLPIYNIYWHGEVTWYEKVGGFDGHRRAVKIGCDFQHLFDEHKSYNFDYIYSEAKKTIKELHQWTEVKKWCVNCGAYFYPRDHKYCEDCREKRGE